MSNESVEPVGGRESTDSFAGCLVKLGWTFGGAALLFACAIAIAREATWTFTVKDALYWLVVAGLIGLRYADVARFGGRTMDGEPATRRDVARYAAGVAIASAVVWALAHSVQV